MKARSPLIATVLTLALGLSAAYWLGSERKDLEAFCRSIEIGRPLAEVRLAARRAGWLPKMEPFAQMRVEAPVWEAWHLSPPACRVFFGRARTVEYRHWEG